MEKAKIDSMWHGMLSIPVLFIALELIGGFCLFCEWMLSYFISLVTFIDFFCLILFHLSTFFWLSIILLCQCLFGILRNYGLTLHLIQELYETFRNFKVHVADYICYRKITSNMNDRFPDATPEELNAWVLDPSFAMLFYF